MDIEVCRGSKSVLDSQRENFNFFGPYIFGPSWKVRTCLLGVGVPYFNTFFGDVLLKGNHYGIKVYAFSLVTSKPSRSGYRKAL